MASKSIIADLNKGDKLNGDNYETWRHKIWYVLDEQNALDAIHQVMEDPGVGTGPQGKRDQDAYTAWKKKDSTARGILVSSVVDDLILECEQHLNSHDIWAYLKEKFGGTSLTRLRQLTIKFDTYKKQADHNIKQHIRVMSNMIRELKTAGHQLSEEQQIQALIRSLPDKWEHLKVNLTHNEGIKSFADAARHVELEDERLGAARPSSNAFVAESSSKQASGFKRKKNWNKGKKGKNAGTGGPKPYPKKNKNKRHVKRKKDKSKMKCFNCGNVGHFARECPEPRRDKTQGPPIM